MIKYRDIAGDLIDQIARGELEPGDPLPSEVVLAKHWNVARMTAREALRYLVRTGVAADGSPRTVAHRELLTVNIARDADHTDRETGEQPAHGGADAFLADARAAGREPAHKLRVIIDRAGHDLAQLLEVDEDSAVVGRHQVRGWGDTIHNEVTYWYPAGVAHGTPLASPASIIEGALAWLEANRGELRHEVEITSREPGEDEARRLVIGSGPVLVVWRTSRDQNGIPVVVSMAVYPADRTRLRLLL
jgi:GntR family transcriptional regulator